MLQQNKIGLSEIKSEVTIDALGLLCPLPVLKLRKVLRNSPDGIIVKLIADDPVAHVDLAHFCSESGNIFLGEEVEKSYVDVKTKTVKARQSMAFYIKKKIKDKKVV